MAERWRTCGNRIFQRDCGFPDAGARMVSIERWRFVARVRAGIAPVTDSKE
jgi:hypothetical protein